MLNCPYSQHFWHQIRGVFSSHFSSLTPDVSHSSIQFWHYLPGIDVRSYKFKAQSHKTALTLDASHKPQIVTGTSDSPPVNSGGFHNGFLMLGNFLERLTELRKVLYVLVYYKGYNSRTSKWKRCVGQGMEKGILSFYALSRYFTSPVPWCVHQPGNSLNPIV